ncbi:hypothetical protein ACFLU9_00840 [Chloroflexota bacterium]
MTIKQRGMIGIGLQLCAGVVLILDQIVANLQREKEFKDIVISLTKRRIRLLMLICLVILLIIGIISLDLGEGEKWEISTVIGLVLGVMVFFSIYLYGVQWVVNLLEKWSNRRKTAGIESNIIWANAILVGASLPFVVLTGMFFRSETGQMVAQQILTLFWIFIFGLIILPIFWLSIIFFLALGVFQLFVLVRKRVNRIVFWLALFVLWLWGGILLLVNM